MDRFYTNLDLRDIKVGPNSSFPPDGEAAEVIDVSQAEAVAPAPPRDEIGTPLHDGISLPVHHEGSLPTQDGETLTAVAPVRADGATAPPTGGGREVLKVSAKSRPSAVAGAIAGVVRETKRAEVQAIGAGATNQAIKAIAIARDYLAEDEINMICIPEFIDVVIENEERTAIRFIIEPR